MAYWEKNTKVFGKKTKLMEKELFCFLMEKNSKGIGKMTKKREKELSHGLMGRYTKGSTEMEFSMAKVF